MRPHDHVAAILLLGGALFASESIWRRPAAPAVADDRYRIELTTPLVHALETRFAQRFGVAPDPARRQALVAAYVDQEILVREARAHALDVRDASVRLRLLQKMRAVGADPGLGDDELVRRAKELGFDDDLVIRRLLAEEMRLALRREPGLGPPSDGEVRRWLTRHGGRFEQPARVTFRHCFRRVDTLDGDGESTAADLRATLAGLSDRDRIRADLPLDCDGLPLPSRLRAHGHGRLAGLFGQAFAESVFALPAGHWSGPVASTFGLHLVFVEKVLVQQPPSPEAVRSRAVLELVKRRGDRRLALRMAELRARYQASGVAP